MKKLLDTQTQSILPYPRTDDQPVAGLDTNRFKVLTVIDTAPPTTNGNQYLSYIYEIDENALTYTQVWSINENAFPRTIDMRRLKLALLQLDLLDDIDAAIAAQPRQAQIEWEYATDVKVDHPLIQQLANAMSLDINAIFDLAESFT